MAVPKKKTSVSKRGKRRSHNAIKPVNVVIDKNTGEYRLPHHMDTTSGEYNGKQVVVKKIESDEDDDE
jgi:large subunit ribosomal protein L32